MANRIDTRFEEIKKQGRAALVTFITAGDPDHEVSKELMSLLPEAGADIIELGMPFSDPMADGPAIQAASLRALENGATMRKTLEIVRHFRGRDDKTPIVLMGYLNPVLAFGEEDFMKEAAKAGVDGLIIVDLPPEEDEEIRQYASSSGIYMIRLVAPTTDEDRLPVLLKDAQGFLYFVSITGVTGTASVNSVNVGNYLNIIKKYTDLPVAVGFGIKTPQDAAEIGAMAQAVVVGSAIVKTIADNQGQPGMQQLVTGQVRELRKALEKQSA
jgi:tryptophan synthase alpha chain